MILLQGNIFSFVLIAIYHCLIKYDIDQVESQAFSTFSILQGVIVLLLSKMKNF